MKLVAKPAGRPNGIALSPNGTHSLRRQLRRAQRARLRSRQERRASNERVLIAKIAGVPGGIRTDEKGNLYVAGKGIADLQRPKASCSTCIELHGRRLELRLRRGRLKTLFITAGGVVYRARLDVKGAY